MRKIEKEYYIIADPTRGGDLGNYWHYMLGFFLPFSFWLLGKKHTLKNKILVIDACNPLLDEHLSNYLIHLGIKHKFQTLTKKDLQYKLSVKRSKSRKILNRFLGYERKILKEKSFLFIYHNFKTKKNQLILPRWDEYLEQYSDLPPVFINKINLLKTQILEFSEKEIPAKGKPLLILRRSDRPCIINSEEGKMARWFEGYGSERRQLLGIEETTYELNQKGILTEIYEPGSHSLKEQIHKFSNCRGIIAVRGAELINMFWLPKNSIIIMYESAGFKINAIQPKLAKCLNIKLITINHEGENSPRLSLEKVFNYLDLDDTK